MIHVQHALKYSRGGIEITADPTKKCCKTSSIFLKEFSVLLLLPLLRSSLLLQLFLNSSTTLSWVSTAAGAYLEYSIVNSPFPCVAERSAAVVGEGPSVFELLASKDQPLLVRGDALLVLDLGLHVLDG